MASNRQPTPLRRVLGDAADGTTRAAQELLPQVYDELQRLARARLRNVPPGQILQATDLVHEAYLRLIEPMDPGWNSRGHFFGAAAQAMRDILVEQARRGATLKRGGGRAQVAIEAAEPMTLEPADEVLAVEEALRSLETRDPRKWRIAMLRYFAGMTTAETAKVLGVSVGTVGREWRCIRSWLRDRLRDD